MNNAVRLTSTMFKAISFGVFWRRAPSIMEIIRSRNELPSSAVTRTTIRSLITFVPPVTALRSPPLSRMTGADSPVMADSSTVAMPSTISPSPAIMSPASQTNRSPIFSSALGTDVSLPLTSLRGIVLVRNLRKASAWALPRPSAIASAKFANKQVNHNQRQIWTLNRLHCPLKKRHPVVMIEPTHTTNITRFLISSRGFNFLNESMTACCTNSEYFISTFVLMIGPLENATGQHQPMFNDWPQAKCGEKREGGNDHNDPQQHAGEGHPVRWQCTGRSLYRFLRGKTTGNRQRRKGHGEPAQEHRRAQGQVVEICISAQAREGAAVVVRRRGVGVKDLTQPVRALIPQTRESR